MGVYFVEKEIGKVTHFFSSINVAAIELIDTLKIGDKIKIKGATTDFEQTIDSMQINKKEVPEAKSGEEIGTKIKEKVRAGDIVYKL